jgi:hypothetical protein
MVAWSAHRNRVYLVTAVLPTPLFTGKTSWFGGLAFKVKTRLQARSPQSSGITTMLLGLTGCAITGTTHLVGGVSGQTALIVGACVPIGTYVLVRLVSHWTR